MDRRNTIQRDLVLDAVQSLKCHATADEVYKLIVRNHPSVGRGTVYRNLNILADEGRIKRVETQDGPCRFDHTLCEHYHVKCIKCNNVFDVDMEVVPDLTNRIHDTHGIEFLDYDIIFKGICPNCQKDVKIN